MLTDLQICRKKLGVVTSRDGVDAILLLLGPGWVAKSWHLSNKNVVSAAWNKTSTAVVKL
jgi:hypothetical protein